MSREEYDLLVDQRDLYEREMKRLEQKVGEWRTVASAASDRNIELGWEKDQLQDKVQLLMKRCNISQDTLEQVEADLEEKLSQETNQEGNASDAKEAEKLRNALFMAEAKLRQAQATIQSLKKKQPGNDNNDDEMRDGNSSIDISDISISSMDDDGRNTSVEDIKDESTNRFDPVRDGEKVDDMNNEEVKGLEDMANIKTREHQIKMNQMNQAQINLQADIQDKEHLLAKLAIANRREKLMAKQHNQKISELEAEISAVAARRDAMMKKMKLKLKQQKSSNKLSKSGRSQTNLDGDAAHLEAKLQKCTQKLKQRENELKAMKAKAKEGELLKGQQSRTARRMAELNEQISAAKQKQVKLSRCMKEKADIYRLWMKEKDNKVKALLKDQRKQKIQLGRLKSQLEKQTRVLERNHQEKRLLKQKLKRKADKMESAREQRDSMKEKLSNWKKKRKEITSSAQAAFRNHRRSKSSTSRRPKSKLEVANPNGNHRRSNSNKENQLPQGHCNTSKEVSSSSCSSSSSSSIPIIGKKRRASVLSATMSSASKVVMTVSKGSNKPGVQSPTPSDSPAPPNTSPSAEEKKAAKRAKLTKNEEAVQGIKERVLDTLNNGNLKELQALASIGKKRAEQILAAREENRQSNQNLMALGQASRNAFLDVGDLVRTKVFSQKQAQEFMRKNIEKQYLSNFWDRNEGITSIIAGAIGNTNE